MRAMLFVGLVMLPFFLPAQDNYEIQVYGAQTQAKHSSIFELHSNFTFNGEKDIVKGVRPSNHAEHETLEITTGITDNFELGFYLFTNYTSGYGYKVIGSHIRPRIMAPESWHCPVGLSLSLEFGYQSQNYSPDLWNLEIRPIIDKQWDKLYLSFNPTLGISIKGVDNDSRPVFEPNFKASYAFFKKANLGFEYYGSLGPITNFDSRAEQSHALFFAYDLSGNPDWELNIGPGWGLTKATDGFVFKILVGRRILWHGKHKTA
jgi:hypothetical protein